MIPTKAKDVVKKAIKEDLETLLSDHLSGKLLLPDEHVSAVKEVLESLSPHQQVGSPKESA